MTDKIKQRARSVQADTGMPYSTCLRLVRREVLFKPASPECVVDAAMKKLSPVWKEETLLRPCLISACKCPRCAP